MRFEFSEQIVSTRKGPRVAMVVRPQGHYVLDQAWFDRLRARAGEPAAGANPFIDEVARRRGRVRVFVFCGRVEDGSGSYRIDPRFGLDALRERAGELLRAQLPIYREFIRHGVAANVHVGWPARQLEVYREVLSRLARQYERIERSSATPAAARLQARVDRWIARNLLFFLTLGVERALSELLPDKLPLLEIRAARVAELLAESAAADVTARVHRDT